MLSLVSDLEIIEFLVEEKNMKEFWNKMDNAARFAVVGTAIAASVTVSFWVMVLWVLI